MKDECRQNCTDKGQAWTTDVLNTVFALEPVPYVRQHDFLVRASVPPSLLLPLERSPTHTLSRW